MNVFLPHDVVNGKHCCELRFHRRRIGHVRCMRISSCRPPEDLVGKRHSKYYWKSLQDLLNQQHPAENYQYSYDEAWRIIDNRSSTTFLFLGSLLEQRHPINSRLIVRIPIVNRSVPAMAFRVDQYPLAEIEQGWKTNGLTLGFCGTVLSKLVFACTVALLEETFSKQRLSVDEQDTII
jgi:hypothetical protein